MENIEIDGVEHIPISSIELDGSEDISELLRRALDELDSKQAERQAVENDRKLADHINKHYGRELKDIEAFIQLTKIKGLTIDDTAEILTLFKSLPKAAKKSTLSRFLKL